MLCAVSGLPQPIFCKGKLTHSQSTSDLLINNGVDQAHRRGLNKETGTSMCTLDELSSNDEPSRTFTGGQINPFGTLNHSIVNKAKLFEMTL